jgi:hypothetical protein
MRAHRELQQQHLARVVAQIELPPVMELHVLATLEGFLVARPPAAGALGEDLQRHL